MQPRVSKDSGKPLSYRTSLVRWRVAHLLQCVLPKSSSRIAVFRVAGPETREPGAFGRRAENLLKQSKFDNADS